MEIAVLAALVMAAVLLGLVTLALAWLWSSEQRRFVQLLHDSLAQCEQRQNDLQEEMTRMYERLHKATANVTYLESQNYGIIDQHKEDKKLINDLKAENAGLCRELDELRAALANRKPSRSSDDGG